MEKNSAEFQVSVIRILLLAISVIVIAALTSLSSGFNIKITAILLIGYIILLAGGMFISVLLLSVPNSILIKTYGFSVIIKSVLNGFAFLFPFAVLALISDSVLNWNAVPAITSAGIFTCISIADSDLIKSGGKKAGNLVFSFLASVIFMLIYFAAGTITVILLK